MNVPELHTSKIQLITPFCYRFSTGPLESHLKKGHSIHINQQVGVMHFWNHNILEYIRTNGAYLLLYSLGKMA